VVGLNREQAAAFVGVSPSLLDKLVAAGRMPRPRVISTGRLVYDVAELEQSFRALPHQVGDAEDEDIDDWSKSGNAWDHAKDGN
jgi:predicted DNA-binding transcriptional regulator AlpA